MTETGPKSEIKRRLDEAFDTTEILVEEEQGKYVITVIAEIFEGMKSVERQQTVYAPLTPLISGGVVHAVTIRAYTREEWKNS